MHSPAVCLCEAIILDPAQNGSLLVLVEVTKDYVWMLMIISERSLTLFSS